MTSLEFFTQFNKAAPSLQSEALHLAEDEDEARQLYQETAHHAMQRKSEIKDSATFPNWAAGLMRSIFTKKFRQ